jgi:hypothetical protein
MAQPEPAWQFLGDEAADGLPRSSAPIEFHHMFTLNRCRAATGVHYVYAAVGVWVIIHCMPNLSAQLPQ